MVETLRSLEFSDSELVLALVYAVGTYADVVEQTLENRLRSYEYVPHKIRLSEYVKTLQLGLSFPDYPHFDRLRSRMDGGNKSRDAAKRADFLALAAVSMMSKARKDSVQTKTPEPLRKTAHILRSLKRPEEVMALRRIYGSGFFLIGIFSSEDDRRNHLTHELNIPDADAEALIKRDEDEKEFFGQRTRDTFYLADVFVELAGDSYKDQIGRFLNLIFGHPFTTPNRDESAMFSAYAASCRSASLSRQVGAAIVSRGGELVAVGCNDVPCAGGGLYWPGVSDERDYNFTFKGQKGRDTNDACRDEIISEVVARLKPETPEGDRVSTGKQLLKDSSLMDITEYGRAVHAEMEALLACGRSGVSPSGATLYATTFPCHNCTRHIIAAGIRRVFYIEPYPKSRARELHEDSVTLGDKSDEPKVLFKPFVGVGPRRYLDLFSMKLSTGYPMERKSEAEGKAIDWAPETSRLRVPMLPTSYLQREQLAVGEIQKTMQKLEKEEH